MFIKIKSYQETKDKLHKYDSESDCLIRAVYRRFQNCLKGTNKPEPSERPVEANILQVMPEWTWQNCTTSFLN